jgi:transposase
VTAPQLRPLPPRRATWLVLRRPEQRPREEHHGLAPLTAQPAALAEALALVQEFARLVRQRQAPQLDPWRARAAESRVTSLQRFAKGLRDDSEAVRAGGTVPWSPGPVEGHRNRLQTLKRQLCGRAKLALLQQRFVLAA